MNERQKMLLAIGIVEWDGVLTHLDHMTGRGIPVPGRLMMQVQTELRDMCARWVLHDLGGPKEDPVGAAREYITDHIPEADAILEGIKQ